MLVALIERNGKIHLLSYKSTSGGMYRAICGAGCSRQSMVNVVSVDNTFPGICSVCKKYMDSSLEYSLSHNPRHTRSRSQMRLEGVYDGNKHNYRGPMVDYGDAMYRYWTKFNRYVNQVNRNSPKSYNRKLKLLVHGY